MISKHCFPQSSPYKTAVWQNSSRVSALSPEIFLIFWSCSPYVCWLRCTMFQPTLCLNSLNELVGQVLRSQQSEMGLLEKLVRKRRDRFIFSSIMYKSPTTFMKGCTKVKPHKWLCDVKLVPYTLEGRKKRKKKKARVIRLRKSWRKENGWSKVKISGLYLMWLDVKSVKGRKEEKVKEIKG